MALSLSQLKAFPSSQKKRKRVGRGNSAKGGTYGGRGLKGQRARSGGKSKGGHHGKKSPSFISQIPKTRGFRSISPKRNIVNIGQLDQHFTEGETVDPKKLLKAGLVSNNQEVKVLGGGSLKKNFKVSAHRFSKSAQNAIKKAGGSVNLVNFTRSERKKSNKENNKK